MIDNRGRKNHGPRLAGYLRGMLAPGQSLRSYCLEHGLDNQRVSKWETSTGDVSIESMREFGDALGLTLGEVMVIAGYGEPGDFGGASPAGPVAPVIDVDVAIEHDPNLTDFQRRTLRDMLAAMRAVESGEVDEVKVTNAPARKSARRTRR